jgi:hypothetical protein
MQIFSVDRDGVVNATVSLGKTNYRYALDSILPLIDRFSEQRDVQNHKFYERLRRDILRRCLMPPITLAFIDVGHENLDSVAKVEDFLRDNIGQGFVLDGIQRLSALRRASETADGKDEFPEDQALFVNVIVCPSIDNLLYRMITLNNGQKPMTARHQVEILSSNAFVFQDTNLSLVTEKDKQRLRRGVFKKADFELAYMAFLSSSVNVDSQKIIEQKLDELLASKILERDPTVVAVEFKDVIELIGRFSHVPELDSWFKVVNNLIGFCAAIRGSYTSISAVEPGEFLAFVGRLDAAFRAFDVSRIKLGRARRQSVAAGVKRFDVLKDASVEILTEQLIDVLES